MTLNVPLNLFSSKAYFVPHSTTSPPSVWTDTHRACKPQLALPSLSAFDKMKSFVGSFTLTGSQ